MSKVAIQGNASGTGVFTLAAPNSNTDRTLTLPDAAGTMMLTDTGVTTAQMPAGSVLQVVQNYTTSVAGITTSTATYTGFSATITPTSASSKILVSMNPSLSVNGSPGYNGTAVALIYRDTSQVYHMYYRNYDYGGSAIYTTAAMSLVYLDSPNTTSSVEYKLYLQINTGSSTYLNSDGGYSSITLLEIAA